MKTNTDDHRRETSDPQSVEMSETEIDNNLEDTFPASDPPSWTLGSDHRSDAEQKSASSDPKDN
ncbi:MAG: hypothetical protein M3R15_22845 [Acidobacteriota bacterium]|nr:hypothetical protein [Acidobacteriota bacterium]